VSSPTPESVKEALVAAGLEVYRTDGHRITLAERVRLHLMDSGVRVDVAGPAVSFTVRSQRSDSPTASAADLFERVRESMASTVDARGFVEVNEQTREVTDPVDETHVLDVWHELTYEKPAGSMEQIVEDVRWALALPKCVTPG